MTPLQALFATIFVCIIIFGVLRYENDKRFEAWFASLKRQAIFYGFTEEDIKDFDAREWKAYFDEDMNVETAIKTYLEEN